ncbi:MAG: nuclease-related domain-containing protein, partial [Dehalococcoidia bacterium]
MSIEAFIKGRTGEYKTKLIQKLFLDKDTYLQINNVMMETKLGTTQIDQIVVSKYGIFVIETKNFKGWIFGNKKDKRWTELTFNKGFKNKHSFQNPLNQNYKHTKAVAETLNIPENKIHSVVVFWGGCEPKTIFPENVIFGNHTSYIKSKKEVLLSDKEVAAAWYNLQTIKSNTPLLAGISHVKSLKQRYASNTICPKCGAPLIKR